MKHGSFGSADVLIQVGCRPQDTSFLVQHVLRVVSACQGCIFHISRSNDVRFRPMSPITVL